MVKMGKKKRSMSSSLRNQLEASVRKQRRETIWKMTLKRDGEVRCFVCGGLITEYKYATLEHIIPSSKGGTDDMDNLSLSHKKCNERRGNDD